MKRITTLLVVCCLWLLVAASTCFAQMYTVVDLGTLGGTYGSASGINNSGQVVGQASTTTSNSTYHAFRTAPNSPINPATDDLGTLGGTFSAASGINASGQVVGYALISDNSTYHAFRTAPKSPINPATDDLGTLGGMYSFAQAINASGQALGRSEYASGSGALHAFRTAPNSPITPAKDDLGTLAGTWNEADGINDSGQVVGAFGNRSSTYHAFRTAPKSPINPAKDDLGTLGGTFSAAFDINASGQVVGYALISDNSTYHAFRTAPNSPINPAKDDLGTLGGTFSVAYGINASGQVVGWALTSGDVALHAFLYNNGVMYDLNNLIPAGFGLYLSGASDINDAGQIAANVTGDGRVHAVRLNPIYKAFVQRPINADGSSVFKARRGVVPVKFTLTENDIPTCTLPPATISVTRTAGGTLGAVDENSYGMAADSGSNFRIDPTACQYVYNLAASSLGVGTYRVDISINGIFVGHAVFALK